MESTLCKRLHFTLEPVAIFFSDEKPDNAFQARKGQRVCAASMLIAAAKNGTVSVFDEETYGCPGGGVGLCFGNAFEKNNHPTDALLSRGDEVLQQRGETYARSLGKGERFYASPELVRQWAETMPYTETPQRYVVFKPLHLVEAGETPDLIYFFANPDQLSVLVICSGYYRGKSHNVTAPFVSACQAILLAYQEIGKENPDGIMGFFDISQRCNLSKELLSLVVPFSMYCEMEESATDGCMETSAWEKISDRWAAD